MKIEKIKPIPKYMEKRILKIAKEINAIETVSKTEFYSYLTKND